MRDHRAMTGSTQGRFAMRRLPVLVLLASALLVAGCATSDPRSSALTGTLTAYANAIRWDGFDSALQFVDPAWRQAHPLSSIDRARYQQVRVASYDEGEGPIPAGPGEVRQVVQIGVINRNTQAERTVIDHQTWTWDAAHKRWWLSSGLPDITRD
jgi:hypothetical protein